MTSPNPAHTSRVDPGLTDPEADGTTRLTHGETFSGALVALVKLFDRGSLEKSHNGYDDFNQAIKKQRAESVNATQ